MAIDSVRVISNIATGQTGILLAKRLNQYGAKVTLVLGSAEERALTKKISVIRFRLFEELRSAVKKELSLRHYDIIIHSAAVSDFKPKRFIRGKLESKKTFVLELSPLPKIVKEIRRAALRAQLVMFKLEPCAARAELIARARNALGEAGADLVVANRISPRYRAYILDKHTKYAQADSRQALVRGLVRVLRDFKGR